MFTRGQAENSAIFTDLTNPNREVGKVTNNQIQRADAIYYFKPDGNMGEKDRQNPNKVAELPVAFAGNQQIVTNNQGILPRTAQELYNLYPEKINEWRQQGEENLNKRKQAEREEKIRQEAQFAESRKKLAEIRKQQNVVKKRQPLVNDDAARQIDAANSAWRRRNFGGSSKPDPGPYPNGYHSYSGMRYD